MLYGMVFDDKDRALAEQTANGVNGATQVVDNLRTKTGKWFQEEARINTQLLMNGIQRRSCPTRVTEEAAAVHSQVETEALSGARWSVDCKFRHTIGSG